MPGSCRAAGARFHEDLDEAGETFIPTTTRMALDNLREAGHFLAVSTGRSQAMAVDMMHDMGFENMVSNGGYGVTISGKLLGITPLDRNKVIELIHECDEKGFPWGLQVDNSVTRLVPGLDPEDYPEIYKAYGIRKIMHSRTAPTVWRLRKVWRIQRWMHTTSKPPPIS